MHLAPKEIVGPNGKPIADTKEIQLTDASAMQQVKDEAAALMDNPALQQYARAMIVGTQLYAWARNYIMSEFSEREAIKTIVINAVLQTMHTPEGNPIPFAEQDMEDNLIALQTFIKEKVAEHVAIAEKKQQELEKLIKDTVATPEQPKLRLAANGE